ncbi:phosphoenolpyruvate--protein phosphotransferase [Niveibacterium umoris]|uniref:phosphoenolpyruvate--protein phosphotransferase n=1 Tax=Niveibacterium umoris TaxID=1193620 RepID=A0A840BUZ7_9RHOO|nr:phosphoenolpyruvate--protein phosphotransferase [Niveibacterium umoris]MBB4014626.1 phosphocarrier protein FPr [Niveibacterium umoris]
METITSRTVCLNAQAPDKATAIQIAGQMLVDAGYIEPGYIDSFAKREAVANTLLGAGVAIPHGMVDDRHLIRATGVAVVQVRDGVQWKEGESARLVVAIAAQSDEHIALLRRLTRLMQHPGGIDRLVTTDDPQLIVSALGDAPTESAFPAPAVLEWPADAEQTWTVDYPNGLHARPATRWVETARRFGCELRVFKGGEFADARALTGLLSLGITHGTEIRFAARGMQAESAVAAMVSLAQTLSAEEKADAERAKRNALAARRLAPEWTPAGTPQTFYGLGASPGLAVGTLVKHQARRLDVCDEPTDVIADGESLERAILAVDTDLQTLGADAQARLGAAQGAIFNAHRELLKDADLLRGAIALILRGHGPAWAWQQVLLGRIQGLQALGDPLLAARATDLRDVGEQVLERLLGLQRQRLVLTTPTILVAEDLTPSDTLQLDMRFIVGLAISGGGPTSHTAILARTLGLPAIVAAGPALLETADGRRAVIDGSSGALYVDIAAGDLESAERVIARQRAAREALRELRHQPAMTPDGHRVEIAANVANAKQAEGAVEAGAEAIGLMRTEFLFLERDTAPDEEEQYKVYRDMVAVMAGRPLIIRTLDIGGDKQVPYLNLTKEENPFLGVRGARLLLVRQDLLYTQLRALYRAAKHGPIKIMFPMVTHTGEVEALRVHCARARAQVDGPVVPIGIMVEVPAVAVMADRFAPLVDFFSIGTNDLTQYTLAIDRQHPELAAQADSLHPAVLELIGNTVRAARAHQTWVGVCGGLAGDPLGARILTGLGVDELSMSAQDIAAVKAALRAENYTAMQALAKRALACTTAEEVRAL